MFGLGLTAPATIYAETQCPTGENDLTLKVVMAPVKLDRSKSLADIRRLMSEQDGSDATHDDLWGLTLFSYRLNGSYYVVREEAGEGFCARVKSGTIMVFFTQTIMVPSEVEVGSCADGVIMAHESRHVQVTTHAAEDELPSFIRSRVVNRAPGVMDPSLEIAKRKAITAANKVLARAFKEFLAMLNEEQEVVDEGTHTEISDACGEPGTAWLKAPP